MSMVVTKANLGDFILDISSRIQKKEDVVVDYINVSDLVENSADYLSGRDMQESQMSDFISELKQKYAYPQA